MQQVQLRTRLEALRKLLEDMLGEGKPAELQGAAMIFVADQLAMLVQDRGDTPDETLRQGLLQLMLTITAKLEVATHGFTECLNPTVRVSGPSSAPLAPTGACTVWMKDASGP
jgi:hypothetical protein